MADHNRRIQRLRRFEPVERVFRDRSNPLEQLSREEVRDRYRFYPESILLLLQSVSVSLETDTNRSMPLQPLLSVLVTLHFLASGCHYIIIGDIHGISKSSVSRTVKKTTVLISELLDEYINFPTLDADVLEVKRDFFTIAGFPNVAGCIDCTQIRIRGPTLNEHEYVNRKGYHSINVQMICDAKYNILNVVAKWPGSVHDSRVFKESSVCRCLQTGALDGHLLGDSGYPCRKFLLTPYLHPATPAQERYNNALVKTRVLIEQTFGVLKRRFACLHYGLRLSPERTCQTVLACAVLHIFGQRQGDSIQRDIHLDADAQMINQQPPQDVVAGNIYRNVIVAAYFQ